ncbi:MAG: O-antigen ligase family protein [Patescibacteria group bacterium]
MLFLAVLKRFIPKSRIGQFVFILTTFFIIDLLSVLCFFSSIWQMVIFSLITVAFLVLAIRNYTWALAIFLIELIIGSKGYLLFFEHNENLISLRLAWFIIIMAIWLIKVVINRDWHKFKNKLIYAWFAAALAMVWGVINGYFNNEFSNWFLDLNGFLYLAIFLPSYFNIEKIIVKLNGLIYPALTYLALKTLVLIYFYTHFSVFTLLPIYLWVRNSGFGEITYAGGNFFRVFSQSHIFVLVAAVIWIAYLMIKSYELNFEFKKFIISHSWLVIFGLIQLAVLVACLSRSFWLASIACLVIVFLIYAIINKINFMKFLFGCTYSLLFIIAAVGLLFFVTKFPAPPPLVTSSADILLARATSGAGEAAGGSRLNLLQPLVDKIKTNLFWGSGFGSTVTYRSLDPRIKNATAGNSGWYTTYAFEWGYLDTWLKLGLIGLIAYLLFWWYLFKQALANLKSNKKMIAWLVLAGAGSVFITNITTPYLNHPLGIGLLLILALYLHHYIHEDISSTI